MINTCNNFVKYISMKNYNKKIITNEKNYIKNNYYIIYDRQFYKQRKY